MWAVFGFETIFAHVCMYINCKFFWIWFVYFPIQFVQWSNDGVVSQFTAHKQILTPMLMWIGLSMGQTKVLYLFSSYFRQYSHHSRKGVRWLQCFHFVAINRANSTWLCHGIGEIVDCIPNRFQTDMVRDSTRALMNILMKQVSKIRGNEVRTL